MPASSSAYRTCLTGCGADVRGLSDEQVDALLQGVKLRLALHREPASAEIARWQLVDVTAAAVADALARLPPSATAEGVIWKATLRAVIGCVLPGDCRARYAEVVDDEHEFTLLCKQVRLRHLPGLGQDGRGAPRCPPRLRAALELVLLVAAVLAAAAGTWGTAARMLGQSASGVPLAWKALKVMDVDRNDQVDFGEFVAVFREQNRGLSRSVAADAFQRLDSDRDQALSSDEVEDVDVRQLALDLDRQNSQTSAVKVEGDAEPSATVNVAADMSANTSPDGRVTLGRGALVVANTTTSMTSATISVAVIIRLPTTSTTTVSTSSKASASTRTTLTRTRTTLTRTRTTLVDTETTTTRTQTDLSSTSTGTSRTYTTTTSSVTGTATATTLTATGTSNTATSTLTTATAEPRNLALAIDSWPARALKAWEGLLSAGILSGATGLYILSRRASTTQVPLVPVEGMYSAVQPFEEPPVCRIPEPDPPSDAVNVEPPVFEVADRRRRQPGGAWESVFQFVTCGGQCSRRREPGMPWERAAVRAPPPSGYVVLPHLRRDPST